MASYHLRVKDDTKSGGKRISAKKHVDYILREDGKSHADYINREGAQSDRNDCVFKGSQLPKWAKGSPQKFFSAATHYEDKGNVRYREIELSLPNELSLTQNLEIVDRCLIDDVEKLCQTEEAQEKITLIAADILLKNLKIAQEYEEAKKRVAHLYEKLQEAKKRFNAFNDGYKQLKQNRLYRVIQPESNSTKTSALKENELVAIIADALLGEPYAVQLDAHSTGNNLEMEKDWDMMLESDKDELINKMMVREL